LSILLSEDTKVVVQGITGRNGTFYSERNLAYGTKVVAGCTPGKGGQTALDGRVPVFDTVAEAVAETGATASAIYVPGPFASDSILEAVAADLDLVVVITDGIPVNDMMIAADHAKGTDTVVIGPNCPGLISPGKANLGFIPPDCASPGRVGLVSRSGTLTYQIADELTRRGIGQSTCVGIGGDPIIGSQFIDILARFQADPDTDAVAMIGEIGGDAEERAAEFIASSMTKPVVSYIAGFAAPPGKRMGHAGAIITGSSGTAEAKAEALEAKGVRVGRTPTEVADLIEGLR
jgi:succinyl-CoA synthetase alpha subunit